ncbi:MAG: DNA polymerase IV [Pseudomonadota bacterium]
MGSSICRECSTAVVGRARCPSCGSARLLAHDELDSLAIAHVDCDAFYASVEKRDDPALADRPVLVGGGRRGVVAAACYIARSYGVRSAMPMFKARAACPDAVVVKPDMAKYVAASRQIRALMNDLTPLVEPLSIDEAFLDLSGTTRLHGAAPAQTLVRLQQAIKREVGVTVSIGLSWNKFLAKLASEMDKPTGFFVIGRAETERLLARLPVTAIWGVGPAAAKSLAADGLATIGDLQARPVAELAARYGALGLRLHRLAFGRDTRPVRPRGAAKSVSAETTFDADIRDLGALEARLYRLAERVSARMKDKALVGRVVTLKLKRADFSIVTRRRTLARPANGASALYDAARALLREHAGGAAYRLIGVSYSGLAPAGGAPQPDLFADASADEAAPGKHEQVMDAVRARFGDDAIGRARFDRPAGGADRPAAAGRKEDRYD